jgi:hypothetical protein
MKSNIVSRDRSNFVTARRKDQIKLYDKFAAANKLLLKQLQVVLDC